MNFKPQSRKDFNKNEVRIRDLVAKCDGDKAKEVAKAKTMAESIDKPEKAYNRGLVARELGYEHIFSVFYDRAFALGSVTKAEHREHLIDKILYDDEPLIPVLRECENLKQVILANNCTEIAGENVKEFHIKNIAEILKLTIAANFDGFDLSNEDQKHEHEGLLKKLTFNKLKKAIREEDGCWFCETEGMNGEKIYHFEMDSDNLRYAAEINLGENGYDYFRVN